MMMPTAVHGAILFEDNFEQYGESVFPPKWIDVSGGDPGCGGTPWIVEFGHLRARVSSPFGCANNIIPNNSEMSDINNYIFEADMNFIAGTDHNIGYRLIPSTIVYEAHFTAPGSNFSFSHPPGIINYQAGFSYGFNINYHFKARIEDKNVKLYINDILVRDFTASNPMPIGKPALRIGTGGGPLVETWFDNVRITTLDHVDPQPEPGLPVPLLKQTNPLWGSDIYDSASSWSSDGLTMSRWGCAVASASMIFQYNGLEKMEDNSDLTPGSVNQWLKNQVDGYVRGGLLNWLSLSRLSKQIADNNGVTFDALEYESRNPDNAFLANILDNSLPAILSVPGHFIVAKGVDAPNSTFWINDPFDTIVKLSDPPYSNTYSRMGTYTQSNTDLSYIMLVVNPQVEIELLDEAGDPIPTEVSIEGPIDDAEGESINSVGPLKILYAKKPEGGEYQLYLSSATGGSYVVDQYFYDQNGEVKKITASGNLPAGATDEYKLFLDKENSSLSTSEKVNVVTFDSIKTKINEGYKAKKIKDKITYLALVAELEIARKTRFISLKKALLDLMIITISRSRSIDKTFGQDLIADLKVLKASI